MPEENFPTKAEWTPEHSFAAVVEGWNIFDCDGSENGRTQICRDDAMELFASDASVWLYVVNKALSGSYLHELALSLVQKYNSIEAEAIKKFTSLSTI